MLKKSRRILLIYHQSYPMSIKKIDGYDIYLTKILGKGSFGSVYLGKQLTTGDQVAVKVLSKDSIDKDQYLKAALNNEIQILQKLHSENIVGFYDVMESSKSYYLIQQLCDGDLAADVKPSVQHAQAEAIDMLRQICNGFLALVKEGIIHRDLKPANIMKKGKVLKLGDFGFAKAIDKNSMVTTIVGTPLYMSLQLLHGQDYTSKCDIWALGFIFYEILHGNTPWTANTEIQLAKNIEKMPLQIRRKDLSQETQDFIKKSLQLRQKDRISWDQIFMHPIFKGYFSSNSNEFKEFENKLKTIMNKLRFYVAQKNLNMNKIMDELGFGANKNQISYNQFNDFFQRACPNISQEETDYIFKRTDIDKNGSISVNELKKMLVDNGIKLQTQFERVPIFEKKNEESFKRISVDSSNKIKSCFQKLQKIMISNNLTLWGVFNQFDEKKGSLNYQEFAGLLKKICGNSIEISQDEIKSGFDLIDEDGSGTISFNELDKYYSRVNGIHQMNTNQNKIIAGNPQPSQQYSPGKKYQNYSQQQNYQQQNYQQTYQQSPNNYQQSPTKYTEQQYLHNSGGNNGNINVPMGAFGFNDVIGNSFLQNFQSNQNAYGNNPSQVGYNPNQTGGYQSQTGSQGNQGPVNPFNYLKKSY